MTVNKSKWNSDIKKLFHELKMGPRNSEKNLTIPKFQKQSQNSRSIPAIPEAIQELQNKLRNLFSNPGMA